MSVRQGEVAMKFSVSDAFAGYTRNTVAFRAPCSMNLISGAPDSLEQHSLLFKGQRMT